MNINNHRSLILLPAAFIALSVASSCAGNIFLPAGSVKQVNTPVIERETVSIRNQDQSTEPPLVDTYYLGPGDVLFLNISGKPEFSSYANQSRIIGSRIDGQGKVHIPIIGGVHIAGKTIEQAQDAVREAARKFIREPWVVAEIVEYRAKQVFVFGAVKRPGAVPMLPAGLTLPQAIAAAELRDSGNDFRHVRIIRSLSATRGELMVVDLKRILDGDALPLPLRDGDIVYVPKNAFGSWNDAIAEMLPSLQFVSSVLQPFVQVKYLENTD